MLIGDNAISKRRRSLEEATLQRAACPCSAEHPDNAAQWRGVDYAAEVARKRRAAKSASAPTPRSAAVPPVSGTDTGAEVTGGPCGAIKGGLAANALPDSATAEMKIVTRR